MPNPTLIQRVHRLASLLALLCIGSFWLSTVLVELFGSPATVAQVKLAVLSPGLWVLVPALMATGGSGAWLARGRQGRLVAVKRKRMPLIALNGLLVLVPCAWLLAQWAAAGQLDARFYAVQALELLAGAVNLGLMGLNIRDGLRLSGRLRAGSAR
ncbi:MAG: hypothetical protein MUF55_12640 [Hydrogenophaga sp.]|jgi:hypothetical protein|nr:hypothetical protein [Hydrogenophaga sp.]